MLAELTIENLAVISRAHLQLASGLNVITGETGAGKTILAHAISLLLGVRADTGMIRPGADEAAVEAIFDVPPGLFADLAADFDIPDEETLVIRRRISRDGKSRAYAGGRATTLAVLRQLAGRLLAFSAQHEQRSLMMASRQLEILDRFAGQPLLDLKEEFGLMYDRRAVLMSQLAEIDQGSQARAREAALLEFQLDEIEKASLAPGEDDTLQAERRRLVNAAGIREITAALAGLLGSGSSGGGNESLIDSLAALTSRFEPTAGVDQELDAMAERLRAAYYDLEDLGQAARSYSDTAESDPVRLAEIEERLELLNGLKRKYGGTIEEVISYGEKAAQQFAAFNGLSENRPHLQKLLLDLEADMIELATDIRAARLDAASGLAKAAAANLQDLAFAQCGFEVRIEARESEAHDMTPAACTREGADAVEFYVSPNPGMPPAPIRETASGGELSRIMLAIKSSLAADDDAATLVFDEIDAGIGGETGLAVGAKLKSLARASQIICITHLPQIACFGDSHYMVVKESGSGGTSTQVSQLGGGELIDQLCRMMGSKPEDQKARDHCISLLQAAAELSEPAGTGV